GSQFIQVGVIATTSRTLGGSTRCRAALRCTTPTCSTTALLTARVATALTVVCALRSEEHTSELQSRFELVCRLLLEKKKPQRAARDIHERERQARRALGQAGTHARPAARVRATGPAGSQPPERTGCRHPRGRGWMLR